VRRPIAGTIGAVSRDSNRRAPTIVVLHGEERFLVDEGARAIVEGWRAELVSDFGFEAIDGSGLSPARLQDAVLQAPFLDPYRVVFVRAVPANRAEGLAPALAGIPATTRLSPPPPRRSSASARPTSAS
jgi:hypothetical protein